MDDGMVGRTGGEPGFAVEQIPDVRVAAEAQTKAQELNIDLCHTRKILNADELAGLVAPRARLEQHFANIGAYFFSIDGVLAGHKIVGALFAGECMLVFSDSGSKARELANSGLRQTVEILRDEFDTRREREVRDSILNAGSAGEVLGRRSRGSLGERSIPQQRKLAAVMADTFGFSRFTR